MPELSQGPRPEGPFTVLLADDHSQNRRLFRLFLQQDYKVIEATSGASALAVLRERPVDAVLLDLSFPEGPDGFETLRLIREGVPSVPVLALTAHAGRDDQARCLEAGFDGFLAKPFRKQDLLDALARLTTEPSV